MIRNLMKGILFGFVFLVCTLTVNAEECIPPEHDTQTTLNRVLTCNAANQKTTKFSYPQSGQTSVYSNSLCTISCKEDVLFLVDKAKNVRAGMGFNFPLYLSGQRTCTASYNYQAYDTNLRNLVSDRDKEESTSAEYQNLVNQISNLLQTKSDCDSWMTSTKYSMNGNVSLDVETSENIVPVPYKFVPLSANQSTINTDTASGDFCDLKGDSKGDCTDISSTTSSWTEVARIDGRYTMADRYIEVYTGNVVPSSNENTCNAHDMFFTSFYEITRPISTNPTDKGYSLKLTATNLGNNISAGGDKWSLKVDCWYTLKNLIFPQKGTTAANDDEYYKIFGNTAFMYRQVDLSKPFPNRPPGENWEGKETLITSTKSDIQSKTKYEIILNPETIRKIKEYNSHYKYDNYDFTNKGKSKFIEANPDIIKRQ